VGRPRSLRGSASRAYVTHARDGDIVGQYTANGQTPGFYLANGSNSSVSIDMPGPDAVNAQGINNNGLIVGFYVGSDGQAHGFMANTAGIVGNELNGTAIADPVIPSVPGEHGATFVFSQILSAAQMRPPQPRSATATQRRLRVCSSKRGRWSTVRETLSRLDSARLSWPVFRRARRLTLAVAGGISDRLDSGSSRFDCAALSSFRGLPQSGTAPMRNCLDFGWRIRRLQ
jgi:hypothetical protein